MRRYFYSCCLTDQKQAKVQPGNQQQQQQQQQQHRDVLQEKEGAHSDGETQEVNTTDGPLGTGEVPAEQSPKEIEKIPSFDEWKQKMLAEQAEQEKSKQLEGTCSFYAIACCDNSGSDPG